MPSDVSTFNPDREYLAKLFEDLETADTPRKLEVCARISALAEGEDVNPLYRCLKNETELEVIGAMLITASVFPPPEEAAWIEPFLEHQDRNVLIQAIRTVSTLYPERFIDRLRTMFDSPDPTMVVELAPVLAAHDRVEVYDRIKQMLKDPSVAFRTMAVEALRRIASSEARILLGKMVNDPDHELRLRVSRALAEVDLAIAQAGFAEEPVPVRPQVELDHLDEWKQKLLDSDYQIRLMAVQGVGTQKVADLLPFLMGRLHDEDSKYVIASLVKVVAVLGGSRVLEQIKPFLKHDDSRVRANTVEALGSIGAKEVFDLVFPMLNDDDGRVKANSVNVLWSFSQQKMLEKLFKMVESTEVWERSSALYTLEQLNHPKTKHLIKKLLSDSTLDIKVRAAELYAQIETGISKGGRAIFDSGRFDGLDEAESEIMGLSHSDYRRRLKAALALYDIGTPEIVHRLANLLKMEKNEYVIASLVKVIGRLGSETAVDILKPYLTHEDNRVRANTVEAMDMTRSNRRFEILSPCLDDKDARVRANAVMIISRVDPKKTRKIIETMIRCSSTSDRLVGVRCLEDIASPASIKLLKKLTSDQDHDIAEAARESLRRIKEKKGKKKAGETGSVDDELLKEASGSSSGQQVTEKTGSREKLKKLVYQHIQNLQSTNPAVSGRAREILRELLDKSTLPYVEDVLDISSNPRIILPLMELLEGCQPEKAVFRAIPYLKDKREEIRAQAEQILMRNDTSDIDTRLMGNLNSGDKKAANQAGRAIWFIVKQRLFHRNQV